MSIRNLAVRAATVFTLLLPAILLPAIVRGDDFPAPGDAWEHKPPAIAGDRLLPARGRSNTARGREALDTPWRVDVDDGRGHFVEAPAWVLPHSVRGRGAGAEAADFNGDGRLDLYPASRGSSARSWRARSSLKKVTSADLCDGPKETLACVSIPNAASCRSS